MEDKYEKMLERIKEQFIPNDFNDNQVNVIKVICKYIFNNIHNLINLLEWSVEGGKLVCDAPFIGNFVIKYSYEDDQFEVYYEGEFVAYKDNMTEAKLAANDFYRSHVCGILGLLPKIEK